MRPPFDHKTVDHGNESNCAFAMLLENPPSPVGLQNMPITPDPTQHRDLWFSQGHLDTNMTDCRRKKWPGRLLTAVRATLGKDASTISRGSLASTSDISRDITELA